MIYMARILAVLYLAVVVVDYETQAPLDTMRIDLLNMLVWFAIAEIFDVRRTISRTRR